MSVRNTKAPNEPAGPVKVPARGIWPLWLILLVVLLPVALVAGSIFVFLFLMGSMASSLSEEAGDEWVMGPCMVRANDDSALDLVGLSLRPGERKPMLRLVDGAMGTKIWDGQRYSLYAQVFCPAEDWFALDDRDFTLRLFPVKEPQNGFSIRVGDRVKEMGFGQGCFLLKLINDGELSVSPSGHRVDACRVKRTTAPWKASKLGIKLQLKPFSHEVDGTTYTLNESGPGTPFILASAHRGGRPLWHTKLRYTSCGSALAMVPTPDVLVVYGQNHGGDREGMIIGLDVASGSQLYAVPQESRWSCDLSSLQYNRKWVIATWGFGLHAYNPTDGKRKWHIGGRQ